MTQLETDYLIIGSGATGLAFTDIILAETESTVLFVDKHHMPGGHWNDAYPFVTLHQPSEFYGVHSHPLGSGRKDTHGLNIGLHELASGAQISGYFYNVMHQHFLPTGRVQYFPMCNYTGEGNFESILSGDTYHVTYKKIVDTTRLNTSVPSTHTPSFKIDDDVNFIPLNDLPKITYPHSKYVIIGSGKTGIDACLWLLNKNVDPDRIQWIMPRDAWLLNRKNIQPTKEFFTDSLGTQANDLESIVAATSIDDLFDRLEASGSLIRLDPNVRPVKFRGATVTLLELEQLRRVKDVVRLGRIQHLKTNEIILDKGTIETNPQALFIDCSAAAFTVREPIPTFDGNRITFQPVTPLQPVFGAAFIAHVEATYTDEAEKNLLCGPVPGTETEIDWLIMNLAALMNQATWQNYPDLIQWCADCRLDPITCQIVYVDTNDPEKMDIINRIMNSAGPAAAKLMQLISEQAS